jgi:hypothetical protein
MEIRQPITKLSHFADNHLLLPHILSGLEVNFKIHCILGKTLFQKDNWKDEETRPVLGQAYWLGWYPLCECWLDLGTRKCV